MQRQLLSWVPELRVLNPGYAGVEVPRVLHHSRGRKLSPIAIGHFTHRLLDVRRLLEQLTAEQKAIHETLRLAHLRGDMLHLLAPSSEGWCYQLGDGVLLTRRQGRKQWSYSEDWAEMEAQLKARQTYEQTTGQARWRHGSAFWDLRGEKG